MPTTIKKTIKMIVLLSLGFSLVACERITDMTESFMADQNNSELKPQPIAVSAAQEQKIQLLYRALQSKQLDVVKPLLDASLQQQIKQSPEIMQHVFQLVPSEKAEHYRVFTTLVSTTPSVGKVTTAVALFEYPAAVIAVTVVFKGEDGGTTILALTIDQVDQTISSSSMDQIELDLNQMAKEKAKARL